MKELNLELARICICDPHGVLSFTSFKIGSFHKFSAAFEGNMQQTKRGYKLVRGLGMGELAFNKQPDFGVSSIPKSHFEGYILILRMHMIKNNLFAICMLNCVHRKGLLQSTSSQLESWARKNLK